MQINGNKNSSKHICCIFRYSFQKPTFTSYWMLLCFQSNELFSILNSSTQYFFFMVKEHPRFLKSFHIFSLEFVLAWSWCNPFNKIFLMKMFVLLCWTFISEIEPITIFIQEETTCSKIIYNKGFGQQLPNDNVSVVKCQWSYML